MMNIVSVYLPIGGPLEHMTTSISISATRYIIYNYSIYNIQLSNIIYTTTRYNI